MKIRTEEDVLALDNKLKSELGIDVGKYRNPEMAEKFIDLLVFPQFVLNWILRPIIVSLILYTTLFYAFELGGIWTVIYAILGLILFLINGVLIGLILVMWKLKTDIYSVIEYSLNIMKDCVTDLNQVSDTTTKESRKETLTLLFLGITHIVTIPMVTTAISNKIPLIGGLISNLIKRTLRFVAGRIKFNYDPNRDGLAQDESPATRTKAYVSSIEHTIKGLDQFLSVALRVGQFPLAIITFATVSLLGILLLIVS